MTGNPVGLVEFLTQRLDNEEAAWSGGLDLATRPEFAKLAQHQLADIVAKRRIIEQYQQARDAMDRRAPRRGGKTTCRSDVRGSTSCCASLHCSVLFSPGLATRMERRMSADPRATFKDGVHVVWCPVRGSRFTALGRLRLVRVGGYSGTEHR